LSAFFPRPFALSIGPQACGVDILRDYFKIRKDVCLPSVQEICYFDRHIQRGPDFYKEHFNLSEDVALYMELTTTAFDHPQAPGRVKNLLGPDVQLFCPLRDPVERSLAVYNRYLRYGIVRGTIQEACEQAPQILFSSRYADQLEHWFQNFETIYFISYESLQERPEETFKMLCHYLGLPFQSPRRKFEFPKIFMRMKQNFKPEPFSMHDSRAWLREQLADEKARLSEVLGYSVF